MFAIRGIREAIAKLFTFVSSGVRSALSRGEIEVVGPPTAPEVVGEVEAVKEAVREEIEAAGVTITAPEYESVFERGELAEVNRVKLEALPFTELVTEDVMTPLPWRTRQKYIHVFEVIGVDPDTLETKTRYVTVESDTLLTKEAWFAKARRAIDLGGPDTKLVDYFFGRTWAYVRED